MVGLTTVTFEERKGREQEEDEVAASCLLSKHQKKKRGNSLFDTGLKCASLFDTGNIFLPYMTWSLNFLPNMTLPSNPLDCTVSFPFLGPNCPSLSGSCGRVLPLAAPSWWHVDAFHMLPPPFTSSAHRSAAARSWRRQTLTMVVQNYGAGVDRTTSSVRILV
jgi:hypothetical protein